RWYELDAKLTAEKTDPGPAASVVRPPRELPPDVYAFAGRAGELAELDRMLDEGDPATVIVAVSGTAGVGKTALAVHWAHRVTSRDALPGLVARDGARRLDLSRLPARDALGLLHRLIGTRVEEEPAAAARLVTACARLPLALRVAAELAVARPAVSLADLVTE